MKQFYLLVLAVTGISISTLACDICGFGVANYNPFLFPHVSRSYLGVSYQRRIYHTYDEDGTFGKELYNTFLVTAQYGGTKKLQLVALVPYQMNQLHTAKEIKNVSGLGDVSLLANYSIWAKTMGVVRHTVMAGVGVKLPTGQYNAAMTSALDDQNFQQGTGSVDYLLNGTYRIGYRKWILSTAASYKYNTTNKDDYRYGDVLMTGATLIYRKDLDGLSIAPYVQVINEHQMQDADKHVLQEHSGGQVLYTGGGVDMNTRKIAFGVNYQWAPSQNLAQGQVVVNPRFAAHITFML